MPEAQDPSSSNLILSKGMDPLNLMSLDLRFDSLSSYLQNFSSVMNQHASLINYLIREEKTKVTKEKLAHSLVMAGSLLRIKEKELRDQIAPVVSKIKPNDVDDKVETESIGFALKGEELKEAIGILYTHKNKANENLQTLFAKTNNLEKNKVEHSTLADRLDNVITNVYKRLDEQKTDHLAALNEQNQRNKIEFEKLKQKQENFETSTISRLLTLEESMQSKVGTHYIDGMYQNLLDHSNE